MQELIWTALGFLLTLMILSYIIGDNPLFRVAAYMFVGVTAGYVAVIVLFQILYYRLLYHLIVGSLEVRILYLVPLVLGLLLLTRLSSRLVRLGNLPVAYLLGVGSAVTIGGAVLGTIFPQIQGTINQFGESAAKTNGFDPGLQLIYGLFVLVGTAATLMFFYFGARERPNQPPQRAKWIEAVAKVGKVFIGITLGALFAGVYLAALSALVERVTFMVEFIRTLIG
jgi:hypothetical protein